MFYRRFSFFNFRPSHSTTGARISIAAVGIVDILVIIIMSCMLIFRLGDNIIEAI